MASRREVISWMGVGALAPLLGMAGLAIDPRLTLAQGCSHTAASLRRRLPLLLVGLLPVIGLIRRSARRPGHSH